MYKGKFIVFEGGEGSGKTQHVERSGAWLANHQLTYQATHEPGGTALGVAIRDILLNQKQRIASRAELFLFLADRAQHVAEFIEPQLSAGTTVLCDRFSGSTFAYQLGARGLPQPKNVMLMDAYARADITPDLVFYLDVDPYIGIQRKQNQPGHNMTSFDEAEIEFHEEVRSYFLNYAKQQDHWIQLNANRSLEEVQADINQHLETLFSA